MVDEIAEDEEEDGYSDERADAGHSQHEAAYEFAPAKTWIMGMSGASAAL